MLIERHHLRLDQTLAIGDRNIDVLAAHAAGLPAALFAPTPTPLTADFVLADFGALRQILAVPSTSSAGHSTDLGENPEV